ncbi:MAG: hypothetical protein IAE78_32685 [Myxococcus sp.]|nr:hypothetical protein [Myxococcus sp.]
MRSAKVSLADELAEVVHVLESAQLIAELLVTEGLPDAESKSRAPKMLEAMLALAIERVRLLRKVVIGSVDVENLVARHNRVGQRQRGDDPDVHLPVSAPRPSRRHR